MAARIFFVMLVFYFGCSNNAIKSPKTYQIDGYIENLKQGAITLEKLDLVTNERATVATTDIIDGHFSFSDTLGGWGLHSLVLHDSIRIPFFVEPTKINIKIPDFHQDSAIITGGINNELFSKHHFAFEKSAGVDLIYRYPHTTFAAFTTYYVIMNNNFKGDSINDLVGRLTGEALESDYYPHIVQIAQSIHKTSIGQIAPDFTVKDTSGNDIKLSDFRGKYVVLDFWTSWCMPCRQANPQWKELYMKYHEKNVEFFGISFDVKCHLWKSAIKKDDLPWPNGSNCIGWDTVSTMYGVKSVPQTFLIHPDGRILDKNFKPSDFESLYRQHILSDK
jgi:peroxiredoxin